MRQGCRQKAEEKRRRKEEKEAAKQMKRMQKERQHERERGPERGPDHDPYGDDELRRARERDRELLNRDKRKSINANGSPNPYQAYPASPYANEVNDLTRGINGMGVRDRPPYGASGYPGASQNGISAPVPSVGASAYPVSAPNTYPTSPGMRPGGAYPSSPNRGNEPIPRVPSPYGGAGAHQGVYPPGHVMAGQPINPNNPPVMGPRSRATTPIPGAGPGNRYAPPNGGYQQSGYPGRPHSPMPSPNMRGGPLSGPPTAEQLQAPECFARPRNAALPYTPFEKMRIQNMAEFERSLPQMPLVLQPHDVFPEDWNRFARVRQQL